MKLVKEGKIYRCVCTYDERLTPRQAALGKKLVIKYQRQLPAELIEVIKEIRE